MGGWRWKVGGAIALLLISVVVASTIRSLIEWLLFYGYFFPGSQTTFSGKIQPLWYNMVTRLNLNFVWNRMSSGIEMRHEWFDSGKSYKHFFYSCAMPYWTVRAFMFPRFHYLWKVPSTFFFVSGAIFRCCLHIMFGERIVLLFTIFSTFARNLSFTLPLVVFAACIFHVFYIFWSRWYSPGRLVRLLR